LTLTALAVQPSAGDLSEIIRRMRSSPNFDVYVYAIVLSIPIYLMWWMSYKNLERVEKESKATLDQIAAENELIRMKYRQAASASSPLSSNSNTTRA